MITKNELKKVNELRDSIETLQGILRSFESPHVRGSLGLVAIYNSHSKPDPHEDSNMFRQLLPELIKKFNKAAVKDIEIRIKKLEVEISRYITEEKE